MPRIHQDSVREVIERSDILDVVSRFVTLKMKGNNGSGLCPFHNEKTPSFTVSKPKQFFYCFGCQAKGNVIDFVMKQLRLDFPEAVLWLADLFGLSINYEAGQSVGHHKDLHALQTQALELFKKALRQEPVAIAYCRQRGLTGQTAAKFALGFAKRHILEPLKRSDAHLQELSGLWWPNGGQERFQGRLMFPIMDHKGRVCGFGGRVLDDRQPKYLNSPDSPIFHKGKILFGLHQALAHPIEHWVIVEGYLDVLMCHQHGIHQAVATLGTAFTLDHFQLLLRYAKKLYFCFDDDAAGLRALDRSMELLLPYVAEEHHIFWMRLAGSKDPDEFLNKHSLAMWHQAREDAMSWEQYWENRWARGLDFSNVRDRAAFLERAQSDLNKMPNGYFKQLWLVRLEQRFATAIRIPPKKLSPSPQSNVLLGQESLWVDTLRWILEDSSLLPKVCEALQNFLVLNQKGQAFLDLLQQLHPPYTLLEVQNSMFSEHLTKAMEASLAPWIPLEECLSGLQRQMLDDEIHHLLSQPLSFSEQQRLKVLLESKHKVRFQEE